MNKQTKNNLKKNALLKILVISIKSLKCKQNIFKKFSDLLSFFSDYRKYKKMAKKNLVPKTEDLYPRLGDKTENTPLDPVYFFQNSWCAKKIFENKPEKHFDVGSDARFIGLISQFVPTTMVDIRPLKVKLDRLNFIKGDITKLPFSDNQLESLSSICVIEHIGLGRYGDPLDPDGSEKSAKELKRILAKDGNLYISVPVDSENKIYFNAHRAFTRDYILKLFSSLKLVKEKYIYGKEMGDKYIEQKGYGTGLFHFTKI